MSAAPASVHDPTSRGPTLLAATCSLLAGTALVVACVRLLLPAPAPAAMSPSQQFMTSASPNITGVGQTMNLGFGATGVSAQLTIAGATGTGTILPTNQGVPISSAAQGANVANFIEPDAPAEGGSVLQAIPVAPGGSISSTVTFNKPVIGPMLHVVNMDGSSLDIGGTTTSGTPIAVTPFSGNNELSIVGNRLNSDLNPAVAPGCELNDGSNPNGSCGSLRLGPGAPTIQSFTMFNNGIGDTWQWALSFPTAALTKQFSPNRIPQGGTSALTFSISNPNNPAQVDLSPLDFTDALPAGVTLANGSVSNNGSCGSPSVADSGGGALGAGDGGVRASNISVAVGATCTITVNVTSSTPTEPGPPYINDDENNLSTSVANLIPDASTSLAVFPVADLNIVKSTAGPVVPGEQATYELLVTNRGPSTATNEVVSDPLPSGLSFVSASPGCSESGGTVTCSIASLAANASTTFTVTARAAASADCEDLANTATVSGNTADPDMSDNSSTVRSCERRANRTITKVASQTRVPAGGQVMYTLVVKNEGPSDDANVTVSDPLAAGLSPVSAEPSQGTCETTGGRVSCNLGTLKDGGSAQILVTATVTATSGCITNAATVAGDAFDPTADDNRASAEVCVEVPPPPPTTFDLEVDKRASSTRVTVGQRVTYTVIVRNNGPGAAPDAKLTDTYNARATLVSVRTSQGTCTRRIPITCELGRIEAGASATITVVIEPRDIGTARNAASTTSCCGTDTTPDNNMDTADIRVRKVRLALSKVASRSTVQAGETFGYRIRVRNPTKGQARNVKICDRLPSGLSYVSSRPRAKRQGSRQRCWTIKSLEAGKSRTFQVTVRAALGANGRKVNRVTASSPTTQTERARDAVRVLGVATPVTG